MSFDDVPALSSAVSFVLTETAKEDPSVILIEQALGADQGLTSKLLRVVNSAYYGLSGQIGSVGQAIMILGLQQVRNLALSVGAIAAFGNSSGVNSKMFREFWLHAFATSMGAQEIARLKHISARSADAMFVGGLLHDVGRLYLLTHFSQEYETIDRKSGEEGFDLLAAEQKRFGLDHTQVGYEMAKRWNLPATIAEMIRDHEGPFVGTESPMLFGVHAADVLTGHLYAPGQGGAEAKMSPVVENWLSQPPPAIDALVSRIEAKVEEAQGLYSIISE